MREWLFALAPSPLVAYFLVYPAELSKLLHWMMMNLVR